MQGTLDYGILYKASEDSKLIGYVDSDWAGCLDDMKSIVGYVFFFFYGFWCMFIGFKEAKHYDTIYCKGRICGSSQSNFTSHMVMKDS